MWIKQNIKWFLKTKAILVFVLFLCLESEGQELVWAKEIICENCGASNLLYDDLGHFYTTISFEDSIQINKNQPYIIGEYDDNTLIAKFDTSRKLIWCKLYNCKIYGRGNFVLDNNQNICFTGIFKDTFNFTKKGIKYSYFGDYKMGAFFGKLDSSGKVLWINNIDAEFYGNMLHLVAIKSNNLYLVKHSTAHDTFSLKSEDSTIYLFNSDKTNILNIFKFNDMGGLVWKKELTTWNHFSNRLKCNHIEIDDSSNIYIAGYIDGEVDFDIGAGKKVLNSYNTYFGGHTQYLAKYDSNFNLKWVNQINHGDWRVIDDIIIGNNGVYCEGFFNDVLSCGDFKNPIRELVSHEPSLNVYVLGYNFEGELEFSKIMYNSWFFHLSYFDKNIFNYGSIEDSCNIYLNNYLKVYSHGMQTAYVVKYNINKKPIWELKLSSNTVGITNLFQDDKEFLYTVGYFEDSTDFDPSPEEYYLSHGRIFFAKYSPSITAYDTISICKGNKHQFPCGNYSSSNTIDTCTKNSYLGHDSIIITTSNIIEPDTGVSKTQNLFTAIDTFCSHAWLNCHTNTTIFGETYRFFKAKQNGSYALIVNKEGCLDTSACYPVEIDYQFFLPNSFTPNDDGLNDVFEPVGNGIHSYHLKIYNSWGQQVFSGSSNQPWNGQYKNFEAGNGIYYYTIEINSVFDKKSTQTGTVLLIR
jgi:gliding motility-associated-like protein